jgi:hypothetical protein
LRERICGAFLQPLCHQSRLSRSAFRIGSGSKGCVERRPLIAASCLRGAEKRLRESEARRNRKRL